MFAHARGRWKFLQDAARARAGILRGSIAGSADPAHHLKSSIERLTQADRRKDDFLVMIAHELRNPLSAMQNAATYLDA